MTDRTRLRLDLDGVSLIPKKSREEIRTGIPPSVNPDVKIREGSDKQPRRQKAAKTAAEAASGISFSLGGGSTSIRGKSVSNYESPIVNTFE